MKIENGITTSIAYESHLMIKNFESDKCTI